MRFFKMTCLAFLASAFLLAPAAAEDWPTYLHDASRSGIAAEQLDMPLVPVWTFRPVVPPDPAWTTPAKEAPRVRFDDAFHVVAAGDLAYFGSSGDNKVYALDAATGKVVWTYFTDGPVRLAPSVADGRIYFGSDDGYAYCLDAASGELVWKQLVADKTQPVIGHGRMISLWPVRTSVLVDAGIAYVGAGVFPQESIYIAALDAETGERVWRNDVTGERGPEQQYDGVSPQGYLLASAGTLYVPSARSMPAAYDREDGNFLFYLRPGGKVGGSYALLTGEHLVAGVNEQRTYDPKTGDTTEGGYAWSPAHRLIVHGDISYTLGDHELAALDRGKFPEITKKRKAFVAEREKLQKSVREIFRDRYYLKKEADDYQQKYDELTAKLEDVTSGISELSDKIKAIEDESYRWKRENDSRDSMVMAGNTLFVGGEDCVIAVDAQTGEWKWTGSVDGRASGLAIANGQLFVSTNNGNIHVFRQGDPQHIGDVVAPNVKSDPYRRDELTDVYRAAATRIAEHSGVKKGFCLVLGCGEGRLALELARRTDLQIYGIDSDPEKVARAREAIDAAGLYGRRITIDHASFDRLPYPDYFANLIVSDNVLAGGNVEFSADEVVRVLRPGGGVLWLGQTEDAVAVAPADDPGQLDTWLADVPGFVEMQAASDSESVLTRRPLEGGGDWSHQYANTANTANSNDQLVKTPLGILWFGRPGPERMVERHARAAAPLCFDGRLFVQGENVVMAYDMYNGTELWTREIPGAVRVRVDVDGSNMAVTQNGLFVATRDQAMRLDPATGETLVTYTVPSSEDGEPRRWGLLFSIDDMLYGTTAKPLLEEYGARWQNVSQDPIDNLNAYRPFNANGGMWRFMQQWPDWGREDTWKGAVTNNMITSDSLFAIDVNSGEVRWTYEGILPHIVTAADGLLFVIDNRVSEEEKTEAVDARRKKYGLLTHEDEQIASYNEYDVRRIVALDAVTGETVWERVIDLTGSGGDKLGTTYKNGALLFFGHFSNHDGSQFSKGGLSWRRVTVVDGKDGSDKWSQELNYLRRPLVMGDELIVEPRACDIQSGELKMRYHPVTGKLVPWEFKRGGHSCGICTGSSDTFFLRSDSINYYDFNKDEGMLPMGGMRAGCWINMITAGGLALMPEASAGCTCSFPIRTTVALAPKRENRAWSIYVTPGEFTPVEHWSVNLGAPGDRKVTEDEVWFGYPRLGVGYGVKFDLSEKLLPDGRFYFKSPESEKIEGTDLPWVYSCGAVGLLSCELTLLGENDPPSDYTVRLGFCEPTHEEAGKRVFDIKLNGETVAEDFDIAKAAGGRNQVTIQEFPGIHVTDKLKIELVPKTQNPGEDAAPILNSIEVRR